MLRSILGVVVGIVLAMAVIMAVQTLGHTVYPPPSDAIHAAKDHAAMAKAIAEYTATAPLFALLFVPLAWIGGTFCGALAAAWIAGRTPLLHASLVGALPLAGAIFHFIMIPHPAWMIAAGLIGIPLAALAAGWLAPRPARPGPKPYDMREKGMAC